jgi:Putative Flp pilus-assembly TadE/G-like
MTPRADREHGQVLVVFALGIVSLVALLALVVDGGFLYVERRTAQTSADAGALAGARALRELSSIATIRDSATAFATSNAFGPTPTVQCVYLVDTTGAAVATGATLYSAPGASCPAASAAVIQGASGVHVDVRIDFNTFISGMIRIASLSADGHASAQLGSPQSVNSMNSPLIVCGGQSGYASLRVLPGASTAGYVPSMWPVQVSANGQVIPPASLPTYTVSGSGGGSFADQLLNPSGTVDYANKLGFVYYLKGSAIGSMGSDCGTQSNTFDGGADPGPPPQFLTIPGDMIGSKGNNVAAIGSQVEIPGGCPASTNILTWTAGSPGCVMFLPVANGPLGGTGNTPTLVIPQIAPFYVWCNHSSASGTTCQEFVGQLMDLAAAPQPNLKSVGVTGTGQLPSGITAVRLTQ